MMSISPLPMPLLLNDQLTQATEVVRYIAAVGTGYPPPLVLNLEPEPPQRFLEMYIQCVSVWEQR